MCIADHIGNSTFKLARAMSRGYISDDTPNYVEYTFSDGSVIYFFKDKTGEVDDTKYSIADFTW